MRRTFALIVGGGPAGAAAAIALARGELAPLLLERNLETGDALCGGFLSWTTIARLAAVGVDPFALGAHRIDRVALLHRAREAEARLPAPAAALSRRALDAALLAQAEKTGAGIERGITARAFEAGALRLHDGGSVAGESLVLATGKHELRGAPRPRADSNAAIGLRWRLAASPALNKLVAGRIELHSFRGGYAGLNLQEGGGANLCLAVRPARLAEAGARPDVLLAQLAADAPALAERIAAASSVSPPQAIANIPYGWRARTGEPGLYRVGDQCGVIPSLAGEGMAIAIASGSAVAGAILRGEPATLFQPRFARRLRRPVSLAAALWHTAEHPAGGQALVAATHALPWLIRLIGVLTRVN